MSQQVLEQTDALTSIAVGIYSTQQNAEIALRELERFEKRLFYHRQRVSQSEKQIVSTALSVAQL